MTGLYAAWQDYKLLYETLNDIGDNISVSYAPTIDYVTDLPIDQLPSMVADFREEMMMIAAEELKFFKQYGHHLCSWFNGSDSKQHCTSGANMHAIDVDGKGYACHGSLYSPNKELMLGSDIEKDSFAEDVAKMSKAYLEPIEEMNSICTGCVATTCMICPVSSLDNSKNEEYFDRWKDRWVNNMCGFFKAFGEIDRTVQSYLANELPITPETQESKEIA
jgi:uncharacterized protein